MPANRGCGRRGVSVFQPICGNLQPRISRADAADFAGDPAEAGGHLVFAAALRHELHPDANAEKRPAAPKHHLVERIQHAGQPFKPAPAIRERADTGRTTRSARRTASGSLVTTIGNDDWLSRARRARTPLRPNAGCRNRNRRWRYSNDRPRAPGNRPMTPGDRSGMSRVAALRAHGLAGGAAARMFRASKKRRSAISRSSAMTMPHSFQPRRNSPSRRHRGLETDQKLTRTYTGRRAGQSISRRCQAVGEAGDNRRVNHQR